MTFAGRWRVRLWHRRHAAEARPIEGGWGAPRLTNIDARVFEDATADDMVVPAAVKDLVALLGDRK